MKIRHRSSRTQSRSLIRRQKAYKPPKTTHNTLHHNTSITTTSTSPLSYPLHKISFFPTTHSTLHHLRHSHNGKSASLLNSLATRLFSTTISQDNHTYFDSNEQSKEKRRHDYMENSQTPLEVFDHSIPLSQVIHDVEDQWAHEDPKLQKKFYQNSQHARHLTHHASPNHPNFSLSQSQSASYDESDTQNHLSTSGLETAYKLVHLVDSITRVDIDPDSVKPQRDADPDTFVEQHRKEIVTPRDVLYAHNHPHPELEHSDGTCSPIPIAVGQRAPVVHVKKVLQKLKEHSSDENPEDRPFKH